MNVVMRHENNGGDDGSSSSSSGSSRKYECENCRAEFPNKTTVDRHMLFCRTLADIRRGSSGGSGGSSLSLTTCANAADDALMPTPREMFILIQELAAKYNKVKDELDVMKQWAKMVGRRIGGGGAAATGSTSGGGSAAALTTGLDFTSVTRQKRQNMEVILNEEDAEHPDLAELRPGFTEWLSSDATITLTDTDLNNVFNEDLVSGITAAILRVMSEYTNESGKSHLVPLKLADIKQGAFYIYDTAFRVGPDATAVSVSDPPIQGARKWRTMEPCEFQLLVRTFHKLLFKEFKKWQDRNWEAQQQMTKQRQKAATSYHQVMSSFQCSPAMATCDGLYMEYGGGGGGGGGGDSHEEPVTPPVAGADAILSEDFATLYNKYADKMMGGALSDDTIISRVRAKLWKDMKAWRL
jgi:hypothetical protein